MSREYEIGFKKPPQETQFRKGLSGNPKGRPKGSKNLKSELLEELEEEILIREGPTQKRVTKLRAVIKGLMAKAMKGDARSADLLLKLTLHLIGEGETDKEDEPMSDDELAILKTFEASLPKRKLKKKPTTKRAKKRSRRNASIPARKKKF
jgi:hypothetical protein